MVDNITFSDNIFRGFLVSFSEYVTVEHFNVEFRFFVKDGLICSPWGNTVEVSTSFSDGSEFFIRGEQLYKMSFLGIGILDSVLSLHFIDFYFISMTIRF